MCKKGMRPIIKTEMLVNQSKANLDEIILFHTIIHHLDREIRKCWKRVCLGTKIPHSILVNNLLTIEIRSLFLKLTRQRSMSHKSWNRMECGILDSHTNLVQEFPNC